MALSTYYANVVASLMRNVAFAQPATVYAALFTTATTNAGGGTEVTGGSYARQAVTFGAPAAGVMANTAALTFPNFPAGPTTVGWLAICDANTAGNFLIHGPLVASVTINVGQDLTFQVGDLTVSIA